MSQQGLLGVPGPVNSPHGPINGYHETANGPQGLFRHQRQINNPFADDRWPFIPMSADHNNADHVPYSNGTLTHLPADRAASTAGPLRRMGSNLSRQGSAGLIRFGSGDQHGHGATHQHGSMDHRYGFDHIGAGMIRQASSPAPEMPLHGMGMPWVHAGFQSQWAPAVTAADSQATASSFLMHGPHSLLERPGPGKLRTS